MDLHSRLLRSACCGFSALISAFALFPAGLIAQTTAPSPEILTKYDRNHNGRLDPDETAALRADEAKATKPPGKTPVCPRKR